MTAQVTSRNLVVPASLFRAIQSSVVQKPLLSRPKLIEIGRDLSIHKSCTTKLSRPRWRCRAAGFCFDASCQREKDVLFLLSLFIPVVLLAISYVSLNRRTEKEVSLLPRCQIQWVCQLHYTHLVTTINARYKISLSVREARIQRVWGLTSGQNVFESRDGTVFQSPPGFEPERDKKGQLAYKAVSYTPWPIAEGSKGQRLRIKVGPLSNQRPETYVFERQAPTEFLGWPGKPDLMLPIPMKNISVLATISLLHIPQCTDLSAGIILCQQHMVAKEFSCCNLLLLISSIYKSKGT